MFFIVVSIYGICIYFNYQKQKRRTLDVVLDRGNVLRKSKKTEKLLAFIGKTDELWRPNKLASRARSLFLTMQDQWQERNYLPIRNELSPIIYKDHVRQLEGLRLNSEINVIENLKVLSIDLVNVRYTHKPEHREFTVLITASGKNYYIDERTRRVIRGDQREGTHQEFWTFQFEPEKKTFILREIEQSSASDILADENFFEAFTDKGVEQVYGEHADEQGEAGPWLDERAETKENKIERLLNFLVQTDKSWYRRDMLEGARSLFLALILDKEKGTLSGDARKLVFPDFADYFDKHLAKAAKEKTRYEYRNLSVRKTELVLIRNYNDNTKDEFVVRIRAHAQKKILRDDRVWYEDPDVRVWQEYWVFGRHKGLWKLKRVLPEARGSALWEQENFDEDSGQQMMDWYYSKSRAA